MSLQVRPIKAFSDNYIWMMTRVGDRSACIVDPGDAAPVIQALQEEGLQLGAILLTHHHADHVGGVRQLLDIFPEADVYGPKSSRIESVSVPLTDMDSLQLLLRKIEVLSVPGHTLDHIAYHLPASSELNEAGLLFCGDTLFAAGCGRLFEGTAEVMYHSLQKLASLPSSTLVYCAHEYTVSNLRFARAAEPENTAVGERLVHAEAARLHNNPTLPSTIGLELRTNPFLRCHIHFAERKIFPGIEEHSPTEVDVFAALRRWKDNFRA